LVHGGEHPRKNLDFVVKNWIKGGFSREFSIKILGDISPDTKKRIKSIAKRSLKDVIFLGYVSEADMVDLYASAELVICPSLNEGLGLPAIDALNLSKKAVFSDIPSHREFIPNNCTFFNPRRGSSFIRAIANELGSKEVIRRKPKNHAVDWDESVLIICNSFRQKMIIEE
jgi:glycosyltransferase involved in cell wall biosynthesis